MDYEGNPLEDGSGGGGTPTDISDLLLKTQNILDTTVPGTTFIYGDVTVSNAGDVATPIITAWDSPGRVREVFPLTGVQNCLGEQFISLQKLSIISLMLPVQTWKKPTLPRSIWVMMMPHNALIYDAMYITSADCKLSSDRLFYIYTLPTPWELDGKSTYYINSTSTDPTDSILSRDIAWVYGSEIVPLCITTSHQDRGDPSPDNTIIVYDIEYSQRYYYFPVGFQFMKAKPDTSVLTVGDVAVTGIPSIIKMFNDMNQLGYIDMFPTSGSIITSFQPTSSSINVIASLITSPLPTETVFINTMMTSAFTLSPGDGLYELCYTIPNSPAVGLYRFSVDFEINFNRPRYNSFTLMLVTDVLNSAYETIVNSTTTHGAIDYVIKLDDDLITYKYKSNVSLKTGTDPYRSKFIRFRMATQLTRYVVAENLKLYLSQELPFHMRVTSIPGNWGH